MTHNDQAAELSEVAQHKGVSAETADADANLRAGTGSTGTIGNGTTADTTFVASREAYAAALAEAKATP